MYTVAFGSVKFQGTYYKRGQQLPPDVPEADIKRFLKFGVIVEGDSVLPTKLDAKAQARANDDLIAKADIEGYPCGECGFVAKTEQGLKTHMRIHEQPGSNPSPDVEEEGETEGEGE